MRPNKGENRSIPELRILVIGYSRVTQHVLSAMTRAGSPPIGLVTLSERRLQRFSDRGDFSEFLRNGGLIHRAEDIHAPLTVQWITSLRPDALFVMGWSQIIRPELLSLAPLGAFGSHPSLLPRHRGRASIPWTILHGDSESALSLFRLAAEVDTGELLVQTRFRLSDRETATTLYQKAIEALYPSISDLLSQISTNRFTPISPTATESYNFGRTPSDGLIDWSLSADQIDRLIRASTDPYPGAFTFLGREKIIIRESEIGPLRTGAYSALSGQLIERFPDGTLEVQTGSGTLLLRTVERGNGGRKGSLPLSIPIGRRFGIDLALIMETLSVQEAEIQRSATASSTALQTLSTSSDESVV